MAALTASEALEWALEIEKNGEAFYTEAALTSVNSEVKALLLDLAAQERGHSNVFSKMLEGVKSVDDFTHLDKDEYHEYLLAALDNALFSGPDKGLAAIAQAEDPMAVVRAALGFEKDTLLFFYDLREMVSAAQRETISNVIREEKAHLRLLVGMLS